ncbi:MAG TPA: transposase [Myxococcaceae bacterium]|nr:transposase [Myxococcaceae bacterium]
MASSGEGPSAPRGTWPTGGSKERARRRLRRLEQAALQPDADFELWYADGTRFDLLPVVRHMWRRRGKRLLVPTPGKNVKVAICGAYCFPEGPFLFSHGSGSVNTALFLKMLSLLVAHAKRTGKRVVLVLDNGGAFTSKRSTQEFKKVKAWVSVFWLPKYTSETLNRIEGVWGHLKDAFFSRMLTQDPAAFYPAAVRLLRRLRRRRALRRALRPTRRRAPART